MDLPQDPDPAGLVTARKTVEYFLISAPSSDLPSGDIPSKKDLLKMIIWERDRLEKEKTSKFIGFDKFPALLVELLKKCLTEPNFFLKQKISTSGSVLEFVENNKIKNLVHLSLSLFAINEADKVEESLGSGLSAQPRTLDG